MCCSVLQYVAVTCVSLTSIENAQMQSRWDNYGPSGYAVFFYETGVLQVCCNYVASVLQCVAVCCSVLKCVAVCCRVLQCVAVC